VAKLHKAIEDSKQKGFDKVLYGLGIRHVGERTAQVLAESFASMDKLAMADVEMLKGIHDIGEETAKTVVDALKSDKLKSVVERLKSAGLKFEAEAKEVVSDKLSGKTFVVTGTLSKPRDHFKKLIADNGGKVISAVSGKLDYLLVGEKAGSKLEKAEKLGVDILDEDAFMRMINE